MTYSYKIKYARNKKSKPKNNLNKLSYAAKIFNQFIICCLIILSILVLNLIKLDQQKEIKNLKSELKNILAQNNLILDFDLDFNLKSDLKKIKDLYLDLDFNALNKNICLDLGLDLDKIFNINLEKDKNQTEIIDIDKKIIKSIINEDKELKSIKKKLF